MTPHRLRAAGASDTIPSATLGYEHITLSVGLPLSYAFCVVWGCKGSRPAETVGVNRRA